MTNRQHILSTARRLAIDAGTIPSLDAIASTAGVSKGGLMHHFRSRSALLAGLAEQAIATIDNALAAAVPEGRVVETWLRISLCRDEADLYRALLTTFSGAGTTTDELLQNSVAASARWEVLLAAELGDPTAATMVRLLGDGLVMNAVTGDALPALEDMLRWIDTRGDRS